MYLSKKRGFIIGSLILFIILLIIGFTFFKKDEEITTFDTTTLGNPTVDPENVDDQEEGKNVTASDLSLVQGKSNGIDISKWQGKIDWKKVKADHIDFAFIRIGYRGEDGKLYKDDNADYNIQEAQKAGVLVGVYFYSTAIHEKEAIEEAKWTLQCMKGYSISYPVVYDCEGYKNAKSRTYQLKQDTRTQNAVAFLQTIKKADYDVMFYSALSDIDHYWNISAIEKVAKIWIAQYSSTIYPQKIKPDYQGNCHAWQYTNKGHVKGINGNVDMVVCYFKNEKEQPKDQNVALPKAKIPLTETEKQYKSVNEKVTAKSKTNLRQSATTKSNLIATLKNGETVTRIGIGTNGWSKLRYHNQTVYAITSYLTTDLTIKEEVKEDIVAGQKFTVKKDKVTAKDHVNLRHLPTTDSQVVGTLKSGDFLQRIAVSQNGWSRLIYKGQNVYAVSSYLSHEVISKPETPVSDGFSRVDEQVTAKSETNLRDQPNTTGSSVVYKLKNGEYVKRIGIHSNGWSKLEYKGQIVYAISSYLTK